MLKSYIQIFLQGFQRKCPQCGHKGIFSGYLAVRSECPTCHVALGHLPSHDAPPYLTLLIVGHVVVPLALYVMRHSQVDTTTLILGTLTLTTLLTLGLLPFMKGGVIAILWKLHENGSMS